MSLSNQQPSPLTEYSQLCKGRNAAESFSEGYHCMEAQKDFSKTEFEWQRTEGRLHEIGLNVNSGGQLKDGLVKNNGFTDEDKLGFFEGKLDKKLKIAKDEKETEVSGKISQVNPSLPESWSLITDTKESIKNPNASEFHLGKLGAERQFVDLDTQEALTDQDKVAGRTGMEISCPQIQKFPNVSVSEIELLEPMKYSKEQENSAWNPHFITDLPNSGVKADTLNKDGPVDYCMIGVVNDNYNKTLHSSALITAQPDPPTTTVELARDESKNLFSNISEMEEDGFKFELNSLDECPLNRGTYQRKAMRRAMSECSHLSVPLTLNMADKYPDPNGPEDLSPSLLSPNNNLTQTQNQSPSARKSVSQMKRSMTVADDQTSAYDFSSERNSRALVKEQLSATEEPASKEGEECSYGSSHHSGKHELGSAALHHTKLEQIPENSSEKGKQERTQETTVPAASNEASGIDSLSGRNCSSESPHKGIVKPTKPATLGREAIEVTSAQSLPSLHQEEEPSDVSSEAVPSAGNITTAPNKQLPPSPEKKVKGLDLKSPIKSPEKRIPLSKPTTTTTPRSGLKTSPGTAKPAMVPVVTVASTTGPVAKNTSANLKRPTSIKTDTKAAEVKKTSTAKSADLSRPKTAPGNSVKSTATTPSSPGTTSGPGAPISRPKASKPTASKPIPESSPTTEGKKLPAARVPVSKPSMAPKPTRPATVPGPDLKSIRSKIGSTDNLKHQPGGGRAKVEKKTESAGALRKPAPLPVPRTTTTTKTAVSKESVQKETNGRVQILNKKVDTSKASSKCGSKVNLKHKPGGGDVKIENHKVNIKDKVQAKVGSLDNLGHVPAGGKVVIETRKLMFRENAKARTDHGADIVYQSPNLSSSTSPWRSTSASESLSSDASSPPQLPPAPLTDGASAAFPPQGL